MRLEEITHPGEIRTDVLSQGYVIAGRYEIQKLLGTGGMGSVYLVADRILGEEQVAIKILHKQFAFEQKYTQRFLREVQLMRRVNHKNVVRTFDVGADGDLVYFTMEYVHGQSLLDLITTRTFPKNQLLSTIIQLCEGLEAIHNANIIHRDLKPGNIIILEDGTIKITDFGVARPETSELTAHNEVIGSSPYIAPEVWLGDKLTNAVDLYSFGVILYELNTGVLPFDAESPALLMRMHLDRAPVPPKELNKTVPSWLNRLILKLLEKSPLARPRDAREIIDYTLSNIDPRIEDSSTKSFLASYASAPSVSNTFIARLEELSQRATDKSATSSHKRDTKRMISKMSSWALRIPSRSHAMSRLVDHVDHAQIYEVTVAIIKKIASYIGSRFGTALLVLGVSALVLVGVSYLFNFLPLLSSFAYHEYDSKLGYMAKHLQWPALFKVGVPYAAFLILTLCVPSLLIGALCGSLKAVLKVAYSTAFFHAAAGSLLFLNHLFPAMTDPDRFNVGMIISAGAAAGRQLAEISLLSPLISNYETNDFMNAIALNQTQMEPLTNSVFLSTVMLIYIAFLVYNARVSLSYSTRKPELIYLILTTGLLALLLIEPLGGFLNILGDAQHIQTFEFLHYKFSISTRALHSMGINWAFVYCAIAIIMPFIGGVKSTK